MGQRIEDCVRKLWEAQRKLKTVSEYVEQVKKKEQLAINNYMFSNLPKGVESFIVKLDDGEEYYMSPVTVRVTKVRKKKMIWDFEKLRYKLGRERYEKVVRKTYTVNNMVGLVEYLKKCGVDPKKFKKFISVEKEMNEDEMDKQLERGKITTSEINGCYDVQLSDPYFRLTEVKR